MSEVCSYRIVLGSASPRRKELMEGAGLEFTVMKADVDEGNIPKNLNPEKVPEYLSRIKAGALTGRLAPDQLLVTADTVVISGDRVLGKPVDREEAVLMLKSLSGKRHKVVTGVTIATLEKSETFSSSTDVFFRELEDTEINYYVDRFQPYDKAGAYGIQEWIGYVGIERIEGSFYNVMGLPVQLLFTKLKNYR